MDSGLVRDLFPSEKSQRRRPVKTGNALCTVDSKELSYFSGQNSKTAKHQFMLKVGSDKVFSMVLEGF